MIRKIECLLYQLYDVSEFINHIYHHKINLDDYFFYSNVLTLACLEEKHIINELEDLMTDYLKLKNIGKKLLSFNKKIKINHQYPTHSLFTTHEDNFHYYFHIPKPLIIEYSKEVILLKILFENFKRDTKDIDFFTDSMEDKMVRLFRIQNRHDDFDTDEWLEQNGLENIKIY